MKKDDFILQAAAKILRVLKEHLDEDNYKSLDKIYIVGSQSIRGKINPVKNYLEGTQDMDFLLPEEELKLPFPEEIIEDLGHIIASTSGTGSGFHEEYGYYLDMLDSAIALPDNWKDRVVKKPFSLLLDNIEKNIEICFLSKEDLVLAKLNANREKDIKFIEELGKTNHISFNKLKKIWTQAHNFKEKINNENPNNVSLMEVRLSNLYNSYSKKKPKNKSKFN